MYKNYYSGVRRKYTERCLQKDTSLWKRVPLKDTTFFRERGPSKRYSKGPVKRYNFFQETGTSNRYTLGPVKRYNFFSNSLPHLFVITVSYIQFIPYTVYKVVPRKDTSFFHSVCNTFIIE